MSVSASLDDKMQAALTNSWMVQQHLADGSFLLLLRPFGYLQMALSKCLQDRHCSASSPQESSSLSKVVIFESSSPRWAMLPIAAPSTRPVRVFTSIAALYRGLSAMSVFRRCTQCHPDCSTRHHVRSHVTFGRCSSLCLQH